MLLAPIAVILLPVLQHFQLKRPHAVGHFIGIELLFNREINRQHPLFRHKTANNLVRAVILIFRVQIDPPAFTAHLSTQCGKKRCLPATGPTG